jgi:4-amino-4-deoxy-L-arabinose transferase-like glycosyltransferase
LIAGLLVRCAVIPFMLTDRLDPWRGHWRFAWEMGMVARSLVTGKGFSSPFPPETGATAWLGPVYPVLMAGVFKVFGMFTPTSAIVLLFLNSVFSVLACIPVYFIARRTLGEKEARWATWIWAFFPYAIYISAGRMWENSLTTLLVTLLVWYTLVLEERATTTRWSGYGALWAFTALANPGACVLLPPLGVWIAWRRHQRRQAWIAGALAGASIFCALLVPWELRNAEKFRQFIPLRDNFWMEVRVGNTGDLSDLYQDWAHPGRSPSEVALYQQLGETAYLKHMRDLAMNFIRRYPGAFASLCVKRFVFTWTGFWSLDPGYTKREPFQFPNTFFCSSVTLLALVGWRRMRREWRTPYVIVLSFFPLVYYLTHPGIEYRHPIDPMMAVLMTRGVIAFMERRKVAN